jgi:hypothetical protein
MPPRTPQDQQLARDDGHEVCKMLPSGEVKCYPVGTGSTTQLSERQKEALALLVGVDKRELPDKAFLALARDVARLIVANAAGLAPACVPQRADEVKLAVTALLDKEPPALLTFAYSPLAGDVVGAWQLNNNRLVEMHRTLARHQRKPKPSCASGPSPVRNS